jgi:hypothetical protein
MVRTIIDLFKCLLIDLSSDLKLERLNVLNLNHYETVENFFLSSLSVERSSHMPVTVTTEEVLSRCCRAGRSEKFVWGSEGRTSWPVLALSP